MLFPKFQYLRDKAHLKRVAALPCQLCFIEGQSQASHSNQASMGKGRGIKASDLYTAAICQRCHYEIDQGRDLTREQRTDMWNLAHERTKKLLEKECTK
jgi:hypothetical protein